MAVGTYARGKQAIRGEKGQILGMRARTPQEVLALILGNAVRDKRTGCLLSTLRKDEKGYARVKYSRQEIRVHRVIFFKGILPKGGPQVLHTCDVRHCVEETHLYAGNNKRNIADKVSRDRSGKKLNIRRARRIKAMLARGYTQKEIAAMSGISQGTVSKIKRGIYWAHVQDTRGAGSVVDSKKSPLESAT